MSIDNAKSTLKVLGVLSIIFGIFGIVLSVAFFSGGHILGISVMNEAGTAGTEGAEAMTLAGIMLVLAVFVLVSAIVCDPPFHLVLAGTNPPV